MVRVDLEHLFLAEWVPRSLRQYFPPYVVRFIEETASSWVMLLVLLVVLIVLIFWIRTFLRDPHDEEGARTQMLLEMSELHRQGGLTADEYRQIKGRLAGSDSQGEPTEQISSSQPDPPSTPETL